MNGQPIGYWRSGREVQSFTRAPMVALGELSPVDAAIHAYTTEEFVKTCRFTERWTPWITGRRFRRRRLHCDPQPVGGLLAIQESMSSLRQPTALGVSRTDAGKSPAATSWYTVDLLKPTRANTSGSLRIRVPESLSATILESLRIGCLQFYEVVGP